MIILLQPALDKNYRRAKASAYAWPGVIYPALLSPRRKAKAP